MMSMRSLVPSSRMTSKGQATIPAEIRKKLGLRAGDTIAFEIKRNVVVISKLDKLDAGFLRHATAAFDDWNAPEADEAFKDL